MQTIATISLLVVAVLLIVVVLLMSGRSQGLGAIAGGAEQLFGRQKARGFDAVLNRTAAVLGTLFFILGLLVASL
ncbi:MULTISPECIES: preprotein translocase subunit SecG [Exiguobacterium]|jgi:preprotein translocase subunit SecG|uniref:Protein-export membrane protein SecG n=8 Tax=Exiguobacterium TaxID=33986 RepID=U1LZL5_9BACL|nr:MULTISPECIES: preprotein translocase subunit SecG [Exiguobacterium]EPE60705.1 preprotein translocase, SecG subunit [Exiguobacterium sp. S17]MCC9622279.1 preprotein translocase subunit SecG [Thalassospira sp. MA62]QLQ21476.1 MAG: preprotein translocase subunit SecG [Paracoccaceae bacterium]QPI68541.1 preprotein translocase subunit SecG [Exiguobacterium sp. PBE]ACQ69783.1 preprotein translocase, SecG subunit [Exiguobacterium sp. AT1b]